MHRRIALALAATLIAAPLAALPTTAAPADEPGRRPRPEPAAPVPHGGLRLRLARPRPGPAGRGAARRRGPVRAVVDASRRTDEGIRTVWKSPGGDVDLPAGSMTTFAGLNRFLKVSVKNVATGKVDTKWKNACLNSYEAHRSRPDAPATNPYPYDCPYNSYTLGSVQGIERGWTSDVLGWQNPLRLRYRGKYDVTIEVAPKFAAALGLDPADVKGTTRVIVKKGGGGEEGRPDADRAAAALEGADRPDDVRRRRARGPGAQPEVAARLGHRHLPQRQQPDASRPPSGTPATARWSWTASARDGEDEMDAYQYFFDADGNQTGYQEVGQMHWDAAADPPALALRGLRPATTLLTADQTEAVTLEEGGVLPGQHRRRRRRPCRTPPGSPTTPTSSTACGERDVAVDPRGARRPAGVTPTRSSGPASPSDLRRACRTAPTTSP